MSFVGSAGAKRQYREHGRRRGPHPDIRGKCRRAGIAERVYHRVTHSLRNKERRLKDAIPGFLEVGLWSP